MKNKKIIVRDIGVSSFSDAWKYQEDIFKKIIDLKIQNRSSTYSGRNKRRNASKRFPFTYHRSEEY